MNGAIISISFQLRALIFTFSVTLATHALSVTPVMPMHVPPSVLLELKGLVKLATRGSTSRRIDEGSEISSDILVMA